MLKLQSEPLIPFHLSTARANDGNPNVFRRQELSLKFRVDQNREIRAGFGPEFKRVTDHGEVTGFTRFDRGLAQSLGGKRAGREPSKANGENRQQLQRVFDTSIRHMQGVDKELPC